MKPEFPSAADYAAETMRHGPLTILDVDAEQAAVTAAYRNLVLAHVNADCLRLAVFQGEYRWHQHPASDELFLVISGRLQIDLADGRCLDLMPLQSVVIPAGTVHRTRAIGRTVNLTVEQIGARTLFVDDGPPEAPQPDPGPA